MIDKRKEAFLKTAIIFAIIGLCLSLFSLGVDLIQHVVAEMVKPEALK